jgi:hypothetical protein
VSLTLQQDEQFWYHGTCAAAAESICVKGIMTTESINQGQDFSTEFNRGFYLGSDLFQAVEWARAKIPRGGNAAVLVYEVKNNWHQSFKHLEITNDDEWEKMIIDCRRGDWDETKSHPREDLHSIGGNICYNPRDLEHQSPLRYRHFKQLALLSSQEKDHVQHFNQSLHAIIATTV